MQVVYRLAHLNQIVDRLRLRQRAAPSPDDLPQIRAFNKIHHQILLAFKTKMMDHPWQRRMSQPGQQQGFLLKLGDSMGCLKEIFFDGYRGV